MPNSNCENNIAEHRKSICLILIVIDYNNQQSFLVNSNPELAKVRLACIYHPQNSTTESAPIANVNHRIEQIMIQKTIESNK